LRFLEESFIEGGEPGAALEDELSLLTGGNNGTVTKIEVLARTTLTDPLACDVTYITPMNRSEVGS
jgi:hypothetical protein